MKIAIINDLHFGVRSDSLIFLDYQKKFFDNVFFPRLEKEQIKTVVIAGDLVDRRKYISYVTSMRMREDFLSKLNSYDVYIIAGNHDVVHKNTNRINCFNELLSSYVHFKVFIKPEEVSFDGYKILLLPWINSENEKESLAMIKKTKAEICIGHLELNGFEYSQGIMSDGGKDTDFLEKFDMVLSGHFHQRSQRDNITYLGAPYEMTWADYNCSRGFNILDLKTRTLEHVYNPFTLFNKYIYNDKDKDLQTLLQEAKTHTVDGTYCKVVVENKTNPYYFDKYIDEIRNQNPFDLKIIEQAPMALEEEQIDEAEDTISILHKTIDSLEIEVDKAKLKSLFGSLYKQAMEMEVIE